MSWPAMRRCKPNKGGANDRPSKGSGARRGSNLRRPSETLAFPSLRSTPVRPSRRDPCRSLNPHERETSR